MKGDLKRPRAQAWCRGGWRGRARERNQAFLPRGAATGDPHPAIKQPEDRRGTTLAEKPPYQERRSPISRETCDDQENVQNSLSAAAVAQWKKRAPSKSLRQPGGDARVNAWAWARRLRGVERKAKRGRTFQIPVHAP